MIVIVMGKVDVSVVMEIHKAVAQMKALVKVELKPVLVEVDLA